MKALLLTIAMFAGPALAADEFKLTKQPAESCATAIATEIKRNDKADTVLITYTAGGTKCTVAVAKIDAKPGVPNRIELGRLKTIAGHSGKPAK